MRDNIVSDIIQGITSQLVDLCGVTDLTTRLIELVEEAHPNEQIHLNSLILFIYFLEHHHVINRPFIGTHNGDIDALWRDGLTSVEILFGIDNRVRIAAYASGKHRVASLHIDQVDNWLNELPEEFNNCRTGWFNDRR